MLLSATYHGFWSLTPQIYHMFCQAQSDGAKIDLVKALTKRMLSLGSSIDETANHNIDDSASLGRAG